MMVVAAQLITKEAGIFFFSFPVYSFSLVPLHSLCAHNRKQLQAFDI